MISPPVTVSTPVVGPVTVTSPATANVTVSTHTPTSVSVTTAAESPVTVSTHTPGTVVVGGEQANLGNGPNYNVIAMMMDDTGMMQMPQHDDDNRWPGTTYPYAPMPFVDSKMANDAIRFTNVRVNARCSPTRGAMLSGRQGHISSVHPFGTGIGDTQNSVNTPPGQVPFWDGLLSSHNPWPAVAKTAGSPYAIGNFAKYHLFKYQSLGVVLNRRAPVDIAGFTHSHEITLSGAGAPLQGYYNFRHYYTDATSDNHDLTGPDGGDLISAGSPDGDGTTGTNTAGATVPPFSPSFLFTKMTEWISSQIAVGKPWFLNWWMNMPHGTLPPLRQACGPNTTTPEILHDVYTQAEQGHSEGLFTAVDAGGKVGVTLGNTMTLYDIDGLNPLTGQTSTDPPGYTSEGGYHSLWRRAVAMFQTMDSLIAMLSDWLKVNHPAEFAKTVFMLYSDNGANQTEMNPIYTNEFGPGSTSPFRPKLAPAGATDNNLGALYNKTIPPTDDGTVTGVPFYDPANSKGSIHEDGIHTPLIVWGDPIPVVMRGTDSDIVIDPTDFYSTFLDFVAKDTWRNQMGSVELAKVDGISFYDRLFSPGPSSRQYGHHTIFKPGWINDELEMFQYERAVVNTAGWKLVVTYEHENDVGPPLNIIDTADFELYNLNVDPGELVDLRPQFGTDPVVTANMLDLRDEYLAYFGIPPTLNP